MSYGDARLTLTLRSVDTLALSLLTQELVSLSSIVLVILVFLSPLVSVKAHYKGRDQYRIVFIL
jgi:hypothetical protein